MLTSFQTLVGDFSNSTPLIISPGIAVVAGYQILLAVGTTDNSTQPNAVADQLGNVGTLVSYQPGASDSHGFSVWLILIQFAGVPIITVTTLGATTHVGAVGAVLSGVGNIQLTSPVNSEGGGLTWPSLGITPLTPASLIIDFDWSYSEPASITDDFISDQSVIVPSTASPSSQLDLAHLNVTSAGTYTSNWSSPLAAGWRNVIVAFAPAPVTPGHGFIPLPFTQRTTAAAAVFPCIQIASPAGAQQLAFGDGTIIGALQLSYAKLNHVYRILRRQDVTNQNVTLQAAVATALTLVQSLSATLQTIPVTPENTNALAAFQATAANAATQISNVKFDER